MSVCDRQSPCAIYIEVRSVSPLVRSFDKVSPLGGFWKCTKKELLIHAERDLLDLSSERPKVDVRRVKEEQIGC